MSFNKLYIILYYILYILSVSKCTFTGNGFTTLEKPWLNSHKNLLFIDNYTNLRHQRGSFLIRQLNTVDIRLSLNKFISNSL